jgi:GGDEF domain-containing protein
VIACFLGLRFGGVGRIPQAYFAAAAFILAATVVETSYLLAYHDELTALPSRRAFNDALQHLQVPYSIAMVDIDHFKRCNDTYGHDTGDQVLRMVASKLARVSGSGQAYRCGGEEFAILFPGNTTADVLEHLEDLRAGIEASSMRLRGPDRREQARGPDRRNPAARSRVQKSRSIPTIARTRDLSEISVTVSIGVATAKLEAAKPEDIIQAADKALYRAKGGGRNRIEIASGTQGRMRTRAAGIA